MAHQGALFSEGTQAATYPAMAYYRLAASLGLMIVLIATASGNSTEIPQRLEFNASDVRASGVFDTLKEGAKTATGFATGIIAASTISPIVVILCVIYCCLRCCEGCVQETQQAPQTVIYTVGSS
ncbi:uncharacterized protein LOC144162766 [Haemaphysalis longicornis]